MKTLFKLVLTLAAVCALSLVAPLAAMGQGVTVTATLTDGQGIPQKTSYLHWQLWNCGNNVPQIIGQPYAMVAQQFDMRANPTTGVISGSVYGNDQIECGNVLSTQWIVTEFKSSGQAGGQPQYYCLTSGQSFNPATTQVCQVVPPPPGYILQFDNPIQSQTLVQPAGTKMNFVGEMNFCSATVDCGGGSGSFSMTVNGGSPLTSPVNFQNGTNTTVSNPSGSNVQVNVTFPTTYYQTVEANGTAQTQEPKLNLISGSNATVNCVDNSGASRTDCTVAATGGGGISGLTTGTFPVATSPTAIGNSSLTNVSSPNGVNYSLGGGESWQLDSSELIWNSGITGSSNILIANTYNPGGGNTAGGIAVQGAPTSGSACAGPAALNGGQNGSAGIASISVGGGCGNGFGAIGGNIAITGGAATGGNNNGQVQLSDRTGTFTQSGGNATETGNLKASSFVAGGATFTASGCSAGTLVGGSTAGKMTLGANSCSVTITMGSSQSAAHGWSCGANDQTTAAGNTQLYFTGGTTTTAVLSVPATAGATDVIDFRCTAY